MFLVLIKLVNFSFIPYFFKSKQFKKILVLIPIISLPLLSDNMDD